MLSRIIDITLNGRYEQYLYRCLAPMPFRKYKYRQEYLQKAIQKGFHKKLLIVDGKIVGQIEYAPAEASGYPIDGKNVTVMNCVWVLRKAKGHNFGKMLIEDMIKSEKNADGFATIALENHWSPRFIKEQMEKLGFKPLNKNEVRHKTKRRKSSFKICLMWLPVKEKAEQPRINIRKILKEKHFVWRIQFIARKNGKETCLRLNRALKF